LKVVQHTVMIKI